jgi:hypothetical protein
MFQIVSCTYNSLELVSIRLMEQLCFAGHCIRSKQLMSDLLLWDHTKFVKSASNANYSRQLLKVVVRVDKLVTSDEEVRKLMLEREGWRSRIKMIVATNKEKTPVKEKIVKLSAR